MVDATDFVPISKDISGAREYVIRLVFDKIHFYIIDNSTGGYIGRLYNTAMTSQEGNWLHIVTTYDGSSTIAGIKIYLDGLRVDDTDYSSGSYTAMENTNTALRIGQQYNSFYSSGKIDDTSIFSSVLSPTKVLSYYNNGEPTDLSSESGLVGYWYMGEMAYSASTWVIPDQSSGGNDGTSVNMDIYDRVGDAPSSSGNTVSYNMDINDRVVSAPYNINSALSYNMVLSGRTTDVPT